MDPQQRILVEQKYRRTVLSLLYFFLKNLSSRAKQDASKEAFVEEMREMTLKEIARGAPTYFVAYFHKWLEWKANRLGMQLDALAELIHRPNPQDGAEFQVDQLAVLYLETLDRFEQSTVPFDEFLRSIATPLIPTGIEAFLKALEALDGLE